MIVLESWVGVLNTNICMFYTLVLSISKLYLELRGHAQEKELRARELKLNWCLQALR